MKFDSYPRNKLISELEISEVKIAELRSKIDSNFSANKVIREIEEKYKFIVNAYGELMSLACKNALTSRRVSHLVVPDEIQKQAVTADERPGDHPDKYF